MDTISRFNENASKLAAATKSVREYVKGVFDELSFVETDAFTAGKSFIDGSDALGEGVMTGYATLCGMPVYLFIQNAEVLSGSFSEAQAVKIEKCLKAAANTGTPFVSIIDCSGARVGEGVGVLEGYAKVLSAAAELTAPHIAVVKGACVGLMSAYAATADLVFVDDSNGYLSLGAPGVIAAKEGSSKPTKKLFGAEFTKKSGLSSLSFKGAADLRVKLSQVMDYLSNDIESSDDANRIEPQLSDNVTLDGVLAAVCDNGRYLELFDGKGSAAMCALTRINGKTVGLIAARDLLCRGSLDKIEKFTRFLDNFDIPLVTLVDSEGAKQCLKCEEKNVTEAAASALLSVINFGSGKVSVIYGNAIGLAYTLLASKGVGFDYVLAFPSASIAPLTADTAVGFLYTDEIAKSKDPVECREKLSATYTEREGNPFTSAKDGFVDNIVLPQEVRPYLVSALQMLL